MIQTPIEISMDSPGTVSAEGQLQHDNWPYCWCDPGIKAVSGGSMFVIIHNKPTTH